MAISKRSSARLLSKGILIGGCLVFGCAAADEPPSSTLFGPVTPGVSVYGMAGNGWTAIGDALVPLFGQPLNFIYVDPQAYYHSSSQRSGSIGLGERSLTSNGILGGYVFGDYDHSANGNDYWFVSPGFERLGQIIDVSANAYFSVSQQRFNTGTEFADQAGDFSHVQFTGHTQYDELVNTFESTGRGADAQVGVRIPGFRNSEVYLGGYYFSLKDIGDFVGGLVRAEIPVNNFISVTMSEAYDRQFHNTLKAGLALSLGGRQSGYSFDGNLAERLVDPIQRNAVAVAGGSGNAQPIVQGTEYTNQIAVEMSNISFFVPGSTTAGSSTSAVTGNGTYENPYQGMTQDNVDNANTLNNRNFYINSGVYNAVYNPVVNPDYIALDNDQLYGRQNNFTQAASGSNRPSINFLSGGFLVSGGNEVSFNDLQLNGNGLSGSAGVFQDHESGDASEVQINDLSIDHFDNGVKTYSTADFHTTLNITNSTLQYNQGAGVFLDNEGKDNLLTANINQSDLSWNGSGLLAHAAGLSTENSNSLNLTVKNSNVDNNSSYGISTETGIGANNVNVQITNDQINANTGAGIVLVNNTTQGHAVLNINNSLIDNNNGDGLFIINSSINGGSTAVNVNHSTINGNTDNGINIRDVFSVSDFNLNLNGVTLSNNGLDGLDFFAESGGANVNIYIVNSQITDNGDSGVVLSAVGSNGSAGLTIKNTAITGNINNGVNFDISDTSTTNTIAITNSVITNSQTGMNVNALSTEGGVSTNVDVNINNSVISNNNTGINLSTAANSFSGGATSASITANINNSLIKDNQVGISANSAINPSFYAVTADTVLNINHSIISDNGTGVVANSTIESPQFGTTAIANTTVDITHSAIIGNGVGVSAVSNLHASGAPTSSVTVDRSIVAGNAVGLSATGNGVSTIKLTNPIFYDGIVDFSGNGVINIPGVTPSSGDRVICTLRSGCTIAMPEQFLVNFK